MEQCTEKTSQIYSILESVPIAASIYRAKAVTTQFHAFKSAGKESLTLKYSLAKALLHFVVHEEFQQRGLDLFCRLIPSLGYHPIPP